MDNQQATEAELGWFAGIIDGEGWLGFTITHSKDAKYKQAKLELRVNNTDPAIIDKCVYVMRKMGVNPYRRVYKTAHVRRMIHECATKHMKTVKLILDVIQPYLVGNKSERAKIMLKFIALRDAQMQELTEYKVITGNRPGGNVSTWKQRRWHKPYTQEQIALLSRCRDLQSTGASETTRESRSKAVKQLIKESAIEKRQTSWL